MNRLRRRTAYPAFCAIMTGVTAFAATNDDKKAAVPPPIKALLVTGGCSHDYETRKKILVQGIRERVKRPIEWVVRHQGGEESDVQIPLFESANWADGYDIVVHDYCFPRVSDTAYVDRILAPHRAGKPAVLIHGTMHSFRTGDDRWFDFCGVTSRRHENEEPLPVTFLKTGSLIGKGIPAWEVARGQLYLVDEIGKNTEGITQSTGPDGKQNFTSWSHLYGPQNARIFATTIGNEVETMITPSYLDLIARGFLWALNGLDEVNYVAVPPDQSLRGLAIPIPEPLPPNPGWNEAIGSEATALASRAGDEYAPGRAVDGNLRTAWESDLPGPASWEVTLKTPTEVGAIVAVWRQVAPPEVIIEGAERNEPWKTLTISKLSPSSGALTVTGFAKSTVQRIRISIQRTDPGYIPAIREFAVFPDLDKVPSALLEAGLTANPEDPVLLTVGKEGIARKVRLAPGWVLRNVRELPFSGTIVDLIPTASGSLFLLTEEPNEEKRRHVFRLAKDGVLSGFVSDLPTGTNLSWDGEWLYTLSNLSLTAFRDTNRDGIADERRRIGVILKRTDTSHISFSGMRMESDGWIYADGIRGLPFAAIDLEKSGKQVREGDSIRFLPDGKSVEVTNSFFKNSTDLSGFQYEGKTVARVDSLLFQKTIGDQFWFLANSGGKHYLNVVERAGEKERSNVDWDRMTAAGIPVYLNSSSEVVRKEAGFEILRRKRNPVAELERMLEGNPAPDVFRGIVETLSALKAPRSLEVLLQAASSKDAEIQILAFRSLAGRSDAANHPVFRAITRTTNPAVSVEILKAILATGTKIDGLNDLVLSFTAHPDEQLSRMAKEFLVAREAVAPCFRALDDPAREADWRGAFEVLAHITRQTVAEGIVLRLERTGSPVMRSLGLETLCRLYHAEEEENKGSGIIEPFLHASLFDYRVDRAKLLSDMSQFGIPLRNPERLVTLAKENIPIEAIVVSALSRETGPLSTESQTWLSGVYRSESRDGGVRLRALGLLARNAMSKDFRELFSRIAKAQLIDAPDDAVAYLRLSWLSRNDLAEYVPWLITQTGGSNEATGLLAWRTILTVRDQPGLSPERITQIDAAVSTAISGGGPQLQRLLSSFAGLSFSGAGEILKSVSGDPEEGTRSTVREVAHELRINPGTGLPTGPPVREVPLDKIIQLVVRGGGDSIRGKQIFRSLACGSCHNVHGEGPASGPDLATVMRENEPREVVAGMIAQHQNERSAGTPVSRFELNNGTFRAGIVHSRENGRIAIEDFAGNLLTLDSSLVHLEWDGLDPIARCDLSATLSGDDFSCLFGYLKSLAL